MKYLLLFFLTFVLVLSACTPDEKEEKVISLNDSVVAYRQATFEVVNGKLLLSEQDWELKDKYLNVVYSEDSNVIGFGYRMLMNLKHNIASADFHQPYFKILSMPAQSPCFGKVKPNSVDFGFLPYRIDKMKDSNQSSAYIFSGVLTNHCPIARLPKQIDSTIKKDSWHMILPYNIGDKQKLWVLYDWDTVYFIQQTKKHYLKNKEKYPLLDSIYHFP